MKAKKSYGYNDIVQNVIAARARQAGEVGIEIECEGHNLPEADLVHPWWITHADGSLRAQDGGQALEYVFRRPVKRDKVGEALEHLQKQFEAKASKLADSYRTSVHVHLNAQDLTVKQVYTWICMYIILEDMLTEFCGSRRMGNLFCLRASDAEYMTQELVRAAKDDYYATLNQDQLRYASCNVKALFDHNSLEFRSMRGTSDTKLIEMWTNLLLDVKDASLKLDNPAALVQALSAKTPGGFLQEFFPERMIGFIKGFKDWEKRMLEGVRLIQDIAYSNNWAMTPTKPVKEDKAAYKYYDNPEAENGLDALLRAQELAERALRPNPAQQRGARVAAAPPRGFAIAGNNIEWAQAVPAAAADWPNEVQPAVRFPEPEDF